MQVWPRFHAAQARLEESDLSIAALKMRCTYRHALPLMSCSTHLLRASHRGLRLLSPTTLTASQSQAPSTRPDWGPSSIGAVATKKLRDTRVTLCKHRRPRLRLVPWSGGVSMQKAVGKLLYC